MGDLNSHKIIVKILRTTSIVEPCSLVPGTHKYKKEILSTQQQPRGTPCKSAASDRSVIFEGGQSIAEHDAFVRRASARHTRPSGSEVGAITWSVGRCGVRRRHGEALEPPPPDALFVLDRGLDVPDGVRGLHLKRDFVPGRSFDGGVSDPASAIRRERFAFAIGGVALTRPDPRPSSSSRLELVV